MIADVPVAVSVRGLKLSPTDVLLLQVVCDLAERQDAMTYSDVLDAIHKAWDYEKHPSGICHALDRLCDMGILQEVTKTTLQIGDRTLILLPLTDLLKEEGVLT